tara:strand:- start:798 stop:1481 length:684 start_codon:yes stop_codon:yes gene_type:complete
MKSYLTSTIFRKGLASLSGLFLVTFLIGHLVGNLQLFIPGVDGQTQFNKYALFMTTNPVVKLLSFITYSAILLHIFITLYLVVQSKRARPVQYAVYSGKDNTNWSSRNMSVLGTILLFFLIVHLKSFWYEMHFGQMPYQTLPDGTKIKDLHLVTTSAFQNPFYTFFYVFCMGALSLHLKHGIESAIQTVGLKIPTYENFFKYAAMLIAFSIPLVFASIPIYLFISSL